MLANLPFYGGCCFSQGSESDISFRQKQKCMFAGSLCLEGHISIGISRLVAGTSNSSKISPGYMAPNDLILLSSPSKVKFAQL